MKNLFHRWLLIFIVLAFGFTFGLSWYLQRKEAKQNSLQLLDVNLKDIAGRVKRSENNLQTITEMSAAAAIAKTRAFALLIQKAPSILNEPETLSHILRKLDVDELHVADKTGKLIASQARDKQVKLDDYLGFNLAKEEQSRVFMRAITDPDFELVQEPRLSGSIGKLFQYTGVARLDEPGVVQIGYRPERIKMAQQLADVKYIESEVSIGINGKLSITENTKYPADYKRVFSTREGLCQSIICGKYMLTAMLPWDEIYSKDRVALTALFFGNIIVFSLIFILIVCLLQKVVIKEISDVTDTLDEFSKGNFDKEIQVNSSSELHALAESINKTVVALKSRSLPARAESDSEITAMLKNSLKPIDIPENANYNFSAEIVTPAEIGGNLYDIFKIDKEHTAFLFVDITDKGVSQDLYMMKAKNMLKKALLKDSPEKALEFVNKELCRAGDKNVPLKVFLGILHLYSGVLVTFNAGHVDPVVKSKNGNIVFIKGPFIPPLGTSSDVTFIPMPLQLNAGVFFYIYSYDTIELRNANGERYGRERLRNVIAFSGHTAPKVVKDIIQDVMAFTGESTLNTEIAVAVLEYTPTGV
ncbi:MAG: SpoIIE family protein phosphatase [Lentisphaeria bacterium]|nr:SpoIIE family protein phosphatase [Lentisphaeria bacterium]